MEFVVEPHRFAPGDNIVIEEVRSQLGTLEKGDTVTVKGAYTLHSCPTATLLFCVTQDGRDPPDYSPATQLSVNAGSASFEMTHRMTSRGSHHVSFYDAHTGRPMGTVYFFKSPPPQ